MSPLDLARALAVLLTLGGCTEDRGARHAPAASATGSAPGATGMPQDTAVPFQAPTTAVDRPRPRGSPGVLRQVSAEAHRGYDRVVFEFSGDSIPGYHVEYADRPARECGSGQVVRVSSPGRMLVRFDPAQAHDESGNPTAVERARALTLPAVKQLTLICDFEGQVEWVLGLAAPSRYRVLEMTGPPRLAVDVATP